MSIEVLDADELVLNDVRYRVRGTIRQRLVNPFPPKVSTGAPDRDSEILLSSIGAETWRGGLLIERLLQNAPTDRLWESTLDSRWERELRLLPLSHTVGAAQAAPGATNPLVGYAVMAAGMLPYSSDNPDSVPANIAVHLWYDTVGNAPPVLTSWSDAGGAFTTLPVTIPRTGIVPLGPAVNIWSDGKFWLCFPIPGGPNNSGILYVYRTSTAFVVRFVAAGAGAVTSSHLVVWDSRLWSYDYRSGGFYVNNTGVQSAFDQSGSPWTARATLTERPFEVRRLLVLYNSEGNPYIHAITKSGLVGYDPVADKWVPTQLQWPRKNSAGAACTWRGDAYIGVGQSLYDYDGRNARNLGIDRDYGLPGVVRGDIAQVADAFSWLAVGTTADDPTLPVHNTEVLLWDGQGWHTLNKSISTNIPFYWLQYLQADVPRLWFSDGAGTHYVDLPAQVYNPKFVSTAAYAPDGRARLPWWDVGWPERTKTWAEVHVRTHGCTPHQVCTITYQLDDDEDDAHAQVLGQMTDDGAGGSHVFYLGTHSTGDGIESYNIRFNVFMSTDDPNKSPVLVSLVAYYKLNSTPRYAYSFQLDCSRPYGGRDEYELIQAGQAAVQQNLFLDCSFRRNGRALGNLDVRRVSVTQFDNTARSGMDERGYFDCTIVEL